MKKRVVCLSLFAAALTAAAPAVAQGWKPDRPVEYVVGVAPGGAVDISARELDKVMKALGIVDSAVVVNKPGGGNTVSWVYLNRHQGDGHYVLVQAANLLTNRIHGVTKLTYSDFTPLCLLFEEYMAVSVRADSPIKTGKELLERLRKDPSSLSVAVASALGNHIHASFAKATKASGIDPRKLKMVAFKSSGDSMVALLGGHVDVVSSSTPNAAAQMRSGKTRILAVTAPKRLGGDLASAPTWAEQGVNGTFSAWRGLLGPKGLAPEQVSFWETACKRVSEDPSWHKAMERQFWVPKYLNSAEVTRYWKEQYGEFREILAAIGLAKE